MVPTIATLTPSRGHTGGRGLVEVTGSGFQTWTIPPPNGRPSGPMWPTVEVLFGDARGFDVAVISPARLFVRAPSSPLSAAAPRYGEGSVSVTVRNLTPQGAVIAGESVTLVNAYRYERPQLALESDLNRLVREVIRLFRSQALANVSISTHSEWDRDTADMENLVEVAELPSLVIFGPRITESRAYSHSGSFTVSASEGEYDVRGAADTDDLSFMLVGISDQKVEAINLQAAVRKVFSKNRTVALQRDPARPDLGEVRYDMQLDASGISFDSATDQKSNLRSFSCTFVVRGFDHEELAGFAGDDVIARGAQVREAGVLVTGKVEE